MVNVTINLHHDGCFMSNPLHYLAGDHRVVEDIDFEGLKQLKTDEDLKEFVKAGYENDFKVDIYTEHNGYNVMEMLRNDNLFDEVDDPQFSDTESQDSLGDVKEGKFIGHMDDLISNLNGRFIIEIDDHEHEVIDSQYKAKKGV
nr:hypothetical protein [Tanacetum cinerariifolium]